MDFSALSGLANASGDQANAVQLLLNQVKVLQDQVTQLTSKQSSSEVSVPPVSNGAMDFKGLAQMANTGMSQMANGNMSQMANANMAQMTNSGMDLKTMMAARMQGLDVPAYGANSASGYQGGQMEVSPSVWISGVPEDFRNTKAIANILGNFGNVMKVKFSRKKPDGVLVQMQDSSQADRCCKCLDRVQLPGGKLRVSSSKIQDVVITPHEDPDSGRDFSRGLDHRYRDINSKFAQTCLGRMSRPTNILMVNNIPEDKMDEAKAYIIESGFDVEEFKEGVSRKKDSEEGERKRSHYAWVAFKSAEDAITAVARLHNTSPSNIIEGKGRRLVFTFTSKTDI